MLEVQDLSAGYGTVPVLRDVNLAVRAGEILLVAGENGAGKSTLLRTIGGFIHPSHGRIRLAGETVAGLQPDHLARMGLRLVLDGHRIFPEISVWDNLRLGAAARPDKRDFARTADEVLDVFPILRERMRQPARNLSGGQQQMLALAQAFVAQPKVLLCDEPSLGLAQALLPSILTFLRDWARRGTAVVLVEQHVEISSVYADTALILDRGEVKLSCAAKDLPALLFRT
ncbi:MULTISPECIES: ABC transporter ATP-binding protein [unclassified Chelatococcus]|uniref:ABC transporter ATP-binding protein n=1 Tax=unclassified Chelatococcus TaxID=2638111 RepID=UPI001BD1A752|nr:MULTISPECIES: ABC transporter ATP-binding protein [unclassified Chelatococcus]MBS7701231.1 ABC transporter ATP-binding protein [Chelatococcus sp. YT9]MBX3557362.1 ABC transporter ATP-binding protein [Chelatococcus sp.]